MSKKELWQIGWTGGQSEGDLTKETVREILNSEIKTYGMLNPRDTLVDQDVDDTISNVIDLQFMTNPADPSETLRVYLTTTHIYIVGVGSVSLLLGGYILDYDSEMVIVEGDSIYVAAIVSGDPVGIFAANYISSGNRWKAPAHMQNHSDVNEDTTGGNLWILEPVGGLTPELAIIDMSSTYTTDVETECALLADKKVVLGTFLKEDIFSIEHHTLPLTTSLSVELAVQFEFHSGQVSALSNTDTASISAAAVSWDRHIGLGINLAVSRDLSKTVRKIHVYRKVLEIEGMKYSGLTQKYELIFTANVMSDDISDLDVNATQGHVLKFEDKADYYIDPDWFYGFTHLGHNTGVSDQAYTTDRGRSLADGSYATETTGWFEFETDTMFYWPRCLTFSGSLTMLLQDSTVATSDYYNALYPIAQGVFLFESGTGSLATMFTDKTAIEAFEYSPAPVLLAGVNYIFPHRVATIINTHREFGPDMAPFITHMGVDGTAVASQDGNYVTDDIVKVLNLKCLLCHLDIGEAGIATLEDIIGYSQVEASMVYPRHIAYSSGRLLMLNIIQDTKNRPSRMVYSEFRKYRSIAKSNYIDYAPRDDGVGVCLAEFKGRILVLHSTSAYIMDISGGSGMSWRELGAYNEINALGRHATVESPFGVFFGGQDFAYLFDGQKIINITERPQSRVTVKYREMVASGDIFFAWRSDLRQLWIISLSEHDGTGTFREVMVFDADSGAWHYHKLNEIEDTATVPHEILALSNQGGNEYVYTKEGTDNIKQFKLDTGDLTKPFNWGITTGPINMGSSEFQKKLKRIYIDTIGFSNSDGAPTYGSLYLNVAGFEQDFAPGVAHHVTRISSSNKAYYLEFTLHARDFGDGSWNGTIESLGLSYKPKKLK